MASTSYTEFGCMSNMRPQLLRVEELHRTETCLNLCQLMDIFSRIKVHT